MPDLTQLASRLEVKEEKVRDWPAKDLVVFSEHPSYFYDMMTKPMLAQVPPVPSRQIRDAFPPDQQCPGGPYVAFLQQATTGKI